MKYLKLFEGFNKKYTNINNIIDGEQIDFYQIPFALGYGQGTCIPDDENYVVCISNNYVYDYISDDDIKVYLNKDLSEIDITKDWTSMNSNDKFEFETAYTNKEKHTLRVAKIVQELLENKKLTPVIMYFDSMSYNYDIKNHIEDGNHRIRALQYLNYDYYPAFIGGSHSKYLINYLNVNKKEPHL